jgi:hypothetical protein
MTYVILRRGTVVFNEGYALPGEHPILATHRLYSEKLPPNSPPPVLISTGYEGDWNRGKHTLSVGHVVIESKHVHVAYNDVLNVEIEDRP